MRIGQSLKWLVIILTLLAAAAVITPAYAQDDATKLPSLLTIEPFTGQPLGTPITIEVDLKNKDGEGNPNKVLILYLNNDVVRRARTDEQGKASIRIGSDLTVGTYLVRVDFEGTQAYLPSSASTTLVIRPAELTITTVPKLTNIPFELDGDTFESDEQGIARVLVSKLGDFHLNVLVEPDTQISLDTRVTFDRWEDEYQPQRTVTIQGDISMEAGFSVSHPVSQSFVDLENNLVDMSRIETITLQGTDGSKLTFDDGSVRWMRGGRIARRQNGLEATQIMYSVESVMINGSNTVNRYQQRFYVKPNDIWPIQLLLYHATFRAADAVFGFPVGKGINVVYPDGHDEFVAFGKDDEVKIGPIPRGVYKVKVIGASGMAPETPLALSRNQELDLKVLSTLNIGLGAALGVVGVVGLLLIGRPYLPRAVFETTRGIVTLDFLKNANKRKYPLPSPKALPAGPIIETVQAYSHMPQVITIQPEIIENSAPVEPDVSDVKKAVLVSSEPVVAATSEPVISDSSRYPGYLGLQDSYHVGSIEGIGDVYQQTYIDAYSGLALVKLYNQKNSRVAAEMLNNKVVPWFKDHHVVIKRVMTDRGREYVGTGKQKKHQYQTALASNGIEYVKNESNSPQINNICGTFHQLIREEVYSKVLLKGKKQTISLEALQQDVDDWLEWYNSGSLLG